MLPYQPLINLCCKKKNSSPDIAQVILIIKWLFWLLSNKSIADLNVTFFVQGIAALGISTCLF